MTYYEEQLEKLYRLSILLVENRMRMSMDALAQTMCFSEFLTSEGERYKGIASAIQKVPTRLYDYVKQNYGDQQATIVQAAFCNSKGLHKGRGPSGERNEYEWRELLNEIESNS